MSSSTQQRVARGLGEDRRRRDRRHVAVALDDRVHAGTTASGTGCRRRAPRSGAPPSASTARRIASIVACRMLSVSISSTSATRSPTRSRARGSGSRAPRAARGAAPSSRARPRMRPPGSRITAAATHGPGERSATRLVDAGDQHATPRLARQLLRHRVGRQRAGVRAAARARSRRTAPRARRRVTVSSNRLSAACARFARRRFAPAGTRARRSVRRARWAVRHRAAAACAARATPSIATRGRR